MKLTATILLAFWPLFCTATLFEGTNLEEPISIALDFSESDNILVRASQYIADYRLTLRDGRTGETLKSTNISSLRGMDELMLVRRQDCHLCVLEMSPSETIDKNSPFELNIVSLDSAYTELPSPVKLKALEQLTNAAQIRQNADSEGGDERQNLLATESEYLRNAEVELNGFRRNDLRLYILILLADSLAYQGKDEEVQSVLQDVLLNTKNQDSLFRVHALYEWASYSHDPIERKALNLEGMNIAIRAKNDQLLAQGSNYKGMVHINVGEVSIGTALFQDALDIHSADKRTRERLKILNNLSWANRSANDPPQALKFAAQQKLLAEITGRESNLIWALYNYGAAYSLLGETDLAADYLHQALRKLASLPDQEWTGLKMLNGYVYQVLVRLYVQNGAYDLAELNALAMRKVFARQNAPNWVENAEGFLAQIYLLKGDLKKARELLNSVLDYNRFNKRIDAIGKTYLHLSQVELKSGNPIAAVPYLKASFKALQTTEDYFALSRAYLQSVKLLDRFGAAKEAEQIIEKTKKHINKFAADQDRAEFAYLSAKNKYELFDQKEANRLLLEAREIVESLLTKTERLDLRRSILALQRSIFELSIHLLLKTKPDAIEQALLVSEEFKARTLKQRVALIRDRGRVTSEQRAERESILEQLQGLSQIWYETKDRNVLLKVRQLSSSLEGLEARVRKHNKTGTANAVNSNSSAIRKVSQGELIVDYFVGAEQSWLWLIDDSSVKVHLLAPVSELQELIYDVQSRISRLPSNRSNSGEWQLQNSINQLTDALLGPVKERLLHSDTDHLTVIADGPLNSLPFSLLQFKGEEKPLISTHSISYAASLAVKNLLEQQSDTDIGDGQGSALVIANGNVVNQVQQSGLRLAALPFVANEAHSIMKRLSNAIVLDQTTSTLSRLQQELNKPYPILHFATHGLLHKQNPSLSGLVLALSPDEKPNQLWLSPQISNSKIYAKLVVLSACESSMGKEIAGEGFLSLSRAFLEAGAKSVISTMWKIEDRASSSLIEEFYEQYLSNGHTPAKALQKAQYSIRQNQDNDWSDPYYWAGFQLVGG